MSPLALLGIKALNGGLFVVLFALVGEVLQPKRFAGLFGAAPSVAIANIAVIVAVQGPSKATASAQGMILGAGVLIVSCLIGIFVVKRFGAVKGSLVMWAAWLLLALPAGLAIWG